MTPRRRAASAFVPYVLPAMSATPSAPAAPLYVARCIDKPGSAAVRAAARPAHVTWAAESGALAFGARILTEQNHEDQQQKSSDREAVGSLIVLRGEQDAAERLFDDDPYIKAGLWDAVERRHWLCTMRSAEQSLATPGKKVYCIWCDDKDGSRDLRAVTRPDHLAWWKAAGKSGLIGPFPAPDGNGAVGTLIVVEGESLEQIKRWAATDPYAKAGLFDHVHVYPLGVAVDSL